MHFRSVFPGMPEYEGLDPSWTFGMNQAVAQGLAIGRDIIFTFGPYASIYTREYHPATDHMMILGSLYLALSYWFALLLLSINSPLMVLFIFFLAAGSVSYDALLFSYPLIATLVLLKVNVASERQLVSVASSIVLLFPFGLLPLIKGSLILICGPAAIVAALHFYLKSRRILSAVVAITPIWALLFFWVMAGQSVYNLPYFIASMSSIISGYTDAMSTSGRSTEIYAYLAAVIFLFFVIYKDNSLDIRRKYFVSCVFFLFLFVAFKAGFVRHDGHELTSGVSIAFASILYALSSNSIQTTPLIFLAMISYMYIDRRYLEKSSDSLFRNVHNAYFGVEWFEKSAFGRTRDWKSTTIISSVIEKKAGFPILPGTTDIYSFNQSYLIASGNR